MGSFHNIKMKKEKKDQKKEKEKDLDSKTLHDLYRHSTKLIK